MISRQAALAGLAAVVAALASVVRPTAAQSIIISMPVASVTSLSVTPSTTVLTPPVQADFAAGFKNETLPLSLLVKSNRAFAVGISASAATFNYTGSAADPNKPRSDLRWSTTLGGSYTPLTSSAAAIATFAPGSPTNGTTRQIYFQTLWDAVQAPAGDYKLTVSFTLSAP